MADEVRDSGRIWRIFLGGAFALVLAVQVLRTATVDLEQPPEIQNKAWPSHSSVLGARIMKGVGEGAARGAAPDQGIMAQIGRLAAVEPLAAEPFLVNGAVALRSGEYREAEGLLSMARQRAPRS
ncbi:MAG: hypothetical protein HOP96_11285, partial [Sphingomonas sp.]|nr:hypothetical protein [Sphingomonas sp.]